MIVDGHQALHDLRASMSDAEFMEKYQVSAPEYRILLNGCARKARKALLRSKVESKGVMSRLKARFRTSVLLASELVGSPFTFLWAFLLVLVWAASGPFVYFGSVWLLVANTVANVSVFLVLFSIQNSQSRYSLEIERISLRNGRRAWISWP